MLLDVEDEILARLIVEAVWAKSKTADEPVETRSIHTINQVIRIFEERIAEMNLMQSRFRLWVGRY